MSDGVPARASVEYRYTIGAGTERLLVFDGRTIESAAGAQKAE